MKRIVTRIVLIVSLGMVLNGCGTTQPQKEAPAEGEEILVGALIPLTGDLLLDGKSAKIGIELAEEEINKELAEKGVGRLRVIIEDTETKPQLGEEKLRSLKKQGVMLVVGPDSSAEAAALRECADREGMILLSFASTAPSLALPGDNLFRLVPDDRLQARALAKMLSDSGVELLIQMWRGNTYGDGLATGTREAFEKTGGRVGGGMRYDPETKDFSSAVQYLDQQVSEALKTHGSDSVAVQLIAYQEANQILREAKKYEVLSRISWIGKEEMMIEDKEAAEFAAEVGLQCPRYAWGETEKGRRIADRIDEIAGEKQNGYSIVAYDALWLMVKSYLSAGDRNDADSLKRELVRTADTYYGATGWTGLNEAGDRKIKNIDFLKIEKEDDKFNWKPVARYYANTDSLVSLAPE